MSSNGVYGIVQRCGRKLGLSLTPEDLRRTLAQMLRNAGAPIEQIQLTLGHRTMATTVVYMWPVLKELPLMAERGHWQDLPGQGSRWR